MSVYRAGQSNTTCIKIVCTNIEKGCAAMEKIIITREKYEELESIIRSGKSENRMVIRARIVLLSSTHNDVQIAKKLEIHQKTVGKWKKRYFNYGIEGLKDEYRSGRPQKFDIMQRTEIIAIACDKPNAFGHEHRDLWTLEALTETVNQEIENINISKSSVQRTLNNNALRPHKTKSWLHSKDPNFREKTNEIVEIYLAPPENSVTICVDEKPMQAIGHKNEMKLPQPGEFGKVEYEYKRNGTQQLIAGFNIETGEVTAHCKKTRTAADMIVFMEYLIEKYKHVENIHIIWDNLNTHYDGPDERWTKLNKRYGNKLVFHYTPIHASWLNQVEIFFSILQRRVIKYGSFESEEDLRNRVLSFIDLWNKVEGHPFNWTFRGYPMQDIKKEIA